MYEMNKPEEEQKIIKRYIEIVPLSKEETLCLSCDLPECVFHSVRKCPAIHELRGTEYLSWRELRDGKSRKK